MRFALTTAAVLLATASFANAQAPAAAAPATSVSPGHEVPTREDPALTLAAQQIGRALFLRCFCAENTLAFDAAGHTTNSKITDWTLAGADIKTVSRKSPTEIELHGLRVAMRYNLERHEWERHPQADEKLHITVEDPHNPAALAAAFDHIFAQGIDAPLQRSMPKYWNAYFSLPSAALVHLASPTNPKAQPPTPPVTPPPPPPIRVPATATHKADAAYTPQAQHNRVQGTVTVRIIIDEHGNPSHPYIEQALGYGLDAAAVAAIERFRFTPATENGKPIASATDITQEFVVVPIPR